MPFGEPYPVSPLIRGIRWALLVAGMFYGFSKQSVYGVQERAHRVEAAKRKIIRDKELALIKEKIAREERETVRKMESGQLFKEL